MDSDIDSENSQFDMVYRWPENMQFKGCIIDRYIINVFSYGLDQPGCLMLLGDYFCEICCDLSF